MATVEEQLKKDERRKFEFSYLSGVGTSSDAPDENLSTAKKETADAVYTPSLDDVVESGFDYKSAITNIDEKYKDLQERIDKPGPFTLTEIQPGDYQLQKERENEIIDAKLSYAESKLGAPVKNHSEMSAWMSALLQRYKTPEVKENAFKYFYPDGDMVQVPIVGTDGKKKVITVYKRNEDEDYSLLYPFGRDVNEFGVVGSELLSFRTIGATLGMLTGSPALAATIGDYLGVKADKLTNWATGKALGFEGGEGEFYKKNKITDVNPFDFFPIQFGKDDGFFGIGLNEDTFGSLLTGGITKGIGVTANLMTGQSRPSLVPITKEIMEVAEELGLPPVLIAQMAINPIVQKTFFRAADITGYSSKKILPQQMKLYTQFLKYGVAPKAADDVAAIEAKINQQYLNGNFGKKGPEALATKERALQKALKEISDSNAISYDDWAKLLELKTLELSNKMKPYKIIDDTGEERFVTPTEGYVGLKKAFEEWDTVFTQQTDDLRSSVINSSKGVSFTIGGTNSLKGLINELETGTGAFSGSTTSNISGLGSTKFFTEGGKLIDEKKAIDLTLPANAPIKSLMDDINALDDVLFNPKMLSELRSEIGSARGDVFSQLESLRKRAFDLMSDENRGVGNAAKKIHEKIISIMDDASGTLSNGGGSLYKKNLNLYLNSIKQYEQVTGLKNMQMAISNKVNPEDFALRFFQPGSGYDLTLLKNSLGKNNVNWTTFEKSFKASLLRDPKNLRKTLETWQKKDPDGLKTLIDDTELEDLFALADTFDTMNNSIIAEAFANQSKNTVANTAEVVKRLVTTAKKKDIGAALEIENFIKGSGGMDGKIMNNMRSGIIEDILNTSSVIDSKTGALVIKPKLLTKAFKDLADDPHMKMFFSKQNLETLEKFSLYTNMIGASSDFGGQLAAAELGGEFVKSLTKPSKLLPALKTMLSFDITARILGRDVTPKYLEKLFKPGLNTNINFKGIRAFLGSVISEEVTGADEQREIDVGVDVPDANFSSNRDYLENFPSNPTSDFATTTSKIDMLREIENIQEDSPRFDQQSSLANPNLGFRTVGAGARTIDPSRAALAFGPTDTLAQPRMAQGGIMNARKQIQRVA